MRNQETPWIEGVSFSDIDPHDRDRRLPLWDESEEVYFGGNWRAEELRTTRHPLGKVAIYGHCLASDSEVKLLSDRALEQDKPELLAQLPGSFTTIIMRPDSLTVLADLANQFPFFYTTEGRSVRFSNLTTPLHGKVPRPDTHTIARRIGMPWTSELLTGRSSVESVHQLEAGHLLHIQRNGSQKISEYETFIQPRCSRDDAVENLRHALRESTQLRARLGRHLSCDFSGGHDSTSLAFLLAHEMTEPLTVTTFYASDSKTDDIERAKAYLALPKVSNQFAWHGFESPGARLLYDRLLQIRPTDEADVSIAERGKADRYYAFLSELGSEIHVTGNGADSTFDLDPRQYIGQFARFSTYPKFIKSVIEVARSTRRSPHEILQDARAVNEMSPSKRLLEISQSLEKVSDLPQATKNRLFGVAVAPEWLTGNIRRQLSDIAFERSQQLHMPDGWDRGNYIAYSDIKSLGLSTHGAMQIAARRGIRIHTPYMDNDVLRACFSIPAHERMSPWEFKSFLRQGVEGLVPSVVTQRNTKGVYTHYGYQGMRASAPIINGLLHNSILADLGVIEPSIVQESIEKAYRGEHVPWASFDGLIASELWLRNLDKQTPDDILQPMKKVRTVRKGDSPDSTTAPLTGQTRYGVPPNVLMLMRPTGAIALNLTSGTYHRLNTSAAHIIESLQSTPNPELQINSLSLLYPDVSRDVLEARVSQGVAMLVKTGLLAEDIESFNLLRADTTVDTAPLNALVRTNDKALDVRPADYMYALGGLVAARGLQHFSFAKRVTALKKLHETWCDSTASKDEAQRLFSAVQRVSDLYPTRIACLELSVTAALSAALKRKRVNVVIGVKTDPDGFHAWPEVNGTPITSNDESITGIYQPIFKI